MQYQKNRLEQGVCHTVALPFTMQKYNVQKILQKKPKSFKKS
jgi:hypothetical protein